MPTPIISCVSAVQRIFEYLDRAISPKRDRELKKHLNACRHCCDRFEFEQLLQQKIRAAAGDEKTPTAVAKRVKRLLKTF